MAYALTVRIPEDQLAALREEYWRTVGQHRLSWNGWLVRRLVGDQASEE